MLSRCCLAASVAASIAACAPALNWREVRPEGTGLQALFPCRPKSFARDVPLAGARLRMTMYSCSAGDDMYAVGVVETGDPTRAPVVLEELRKAAFANVAAVSSTRRPLVVKGMTPNDQAGRFRLNGRRPDGRKVLEEVGVFSRGAYVFQAAVIGPSLDGEATETFFEGLKLER